TQVTAVLSQDWLRRIPSIISLDATPRQYDSLGVSYGHSSGPEWLENWKWRMNRDCFREARRLVTWSEWARQGLVNEYEVPAEKVTVIPPGVDTQAWRRPPGSPPLPGPVRILFVGGNLERKGGGLLLKAFRWLRQPDRVPAAGREPENSLELHLVTKDRVPAEPGVYVYDDMQPNSDRLRQLYFDSHIFCLPTDGDCLPMALSEAAAAGLPLISTRLAGIPEIVQEGRNGFLIQPGDAGALVDALQCLILDPSLRLQMGAEAAALARREFDAGRNTARLIGLIKQIAGDGSKG
ncbi:MAG TPA: glycosyltransferase family 4 protein, partial [Anaerolineales bacterium]